MKTQAAINHFLDSCLGRNLSPVTVGWYQGILRKLARAYPKLPKKPRQIDAFLASLRCDPETKCAHFAVLRAFFKFTAEHSKTPNPMLKVAPPRPQKNKVMATLEPNEELRLLESVPQSNLRDRAILTLFIDSGIRAGELIGLRRQNIQAETIQVRGKTGEHQVPISEETKRLLLSVMAQDGRDEYVFHGRKGVLTRAGIYRIVSTHMRKAGIEGPKLGSHRIRHAFGKGFLVNGGDLRSLQQIMGHSDIRTTQKYSNLNLTDTIAKHHKFTPLRFAHAAAQECLFDTAQVIKEAEAIVRKEAN